jgi:hypothetical protein
MPHLRPLQGCNGGIYKNEEASQLRPKYAPLLEAILLVILFSFGLCHAIGKIYRDGVRRRWELLFWLSGIGLSCSFALFLDSLYEVAHPAQRHSQEGNELGIHGRNSVTQKYHLTSPNYCNTFIASEGATMANVLSGEKQVAIVSALAEGSSISARFCISRP